MQRLRIGRIPDPARAHGAWVYLALSVLAGMASGAGNGVLPATLAGLGFAGVFLLASAVAVGPTKVPRRLGLGLAFALGAPGLALLFGAQPAFFAYGLLALFPAAISAWAAERQGFQSPMALAMGVCALAVAAPSAACAGGATSLRSFVLLALLLPFFLWRALRIRDHINSHPGGGRRELRRIGQREALAAILWTFLAVFLIHVIPA